MKIYTKTGDKGQTSLVGGNRVDKNHIRLQAYGTIDELNSFLGLLRAKTKDELIYKQIFAIQNNLFVIGAHLATDQNTTNLQKNAILDQKEVEKLEGFIDNMMIELPQLTNFIVYGENETSSICHVCRAIARRAEREIITVNQSFDVDKTVQKYINRLSDYLFTLARKYTKDDKKEDFLWEK